MIFGQDQDKRKLPGKAREFISKLEIVEATR